MTTSARDIAPSSNRLERTVSHSLSVSTSPTATFHSPPSSFGGAQLTRKTTGIQPPKPLKPFDTQDIKILLLENVNQSGKDILAAQGYQVEALKTSLPEDQLIEKIRCASFGVDFRDLD
jgi:D-3-phosphoglycerate dehydrogenase